MSIPDKTTFKALFAFLVEIAEQDYTITKGQAWNKTANIIEAYLCKLDGFTDNERRKSLLHFMIQCAENTREFHAIEILKQLLDPSLHDDHEITMSIQARRVFVDSTHGLHVVHINTSDGFDVLQLKIILSPQVHWCMTICSNVATRSLLPNLEFIPMQSSKALEFVKKDEYDFEQRILFQPLDSSSAVGWSLIENKMCVVIREGGAYRILHESKAKVTNATCCNIYQRLSNEFNTDCKSWTEIKALLDQFLQTLKLSSAEPDIPCDEAGMILTKLEYEAKQLRSVSSVLSGEQRYDAVIALIVDLKQRFGHVFGRSRARFTRSLKRRKHNASEISEDLESLEANLTEWWIITALTALRMGFNSVVSFVRERKFDYGVQFYKIIVSKDSFIVTRIIALYKALCEYAKRLISLSLILKQHLHFGDRDSTVIRGYLNDRYIPENSELAKFLEVYIVLVFVVDEMADDDFPKAHVNVQSVCNAIFEALPQVRLIFSSKHVCFVEEQKRAIQEIRKTNAALLRCSFPFPN